MNNDLEVSRKEHEHSRAVHHSSPAGENAKSHMLGRGAVVTRQRADRAAVSGAASDCPLTLQRCQRRCNNVVGVAPFDIRSVPSFCLFPFLCPPCSLSLTGVAKNGRWRESVYVEPWGGAGLQDVPR